MKNTHALLIVDVQNDFCPGGLFSVPDGDIIIPMLNRYISTFAKNNSPILVSRDWHPSVTHHFSEYGGKWPPHCIANTWGAQFHKSLELPLMVTVISKGTRSDEDAYSAFQGTDEIGRSLNDILYLKQIDTIAICGFATDYCIKYSTLHALTYGFKVLLLTDAIKGINLIQSDSIRSIDEMVTMGAEPVTIDSFYT
jgi:nicotinamidase/pyrazinamidase